MTPTNFQNIFWGVLLVLTSVISELFQEYLMVWFLHIVSFGQLWTLVTRTGYASQFFFFLNLLQYSVQFSSVAQFCRTLCDPMNCSTSGLPVHHQLPEPTQTHVHWVGDAIQLSHPLLSPSPPALNLPQHQGLFKWVSSSHEVAKVLEFLLQRQSFQWTPRTDLL